MFDGVRMSLVQSGSVFGRPLGTRYASQREASNFAIHLIFGAVAVPADGKSVVEAAFAKVVFVGWLGILLISDLSNIEVAPVINLPSFPYDSDALHFGRRIMPVVAPEGVDGNGAVGGRGINELIPEVGGGHVGTRVAGTIVFGVGTL